MIDNPAHSLVFGSITMVDEGGYPPDSNGVRYIVRPTDTTWGNPSPVTVAVLSLLKQGSLVAYDHTENREPVLRVTIQADDAEQLARGERALQLECQKANTLTWTPPDGVGQPTVFDVVWSQMELDFDHQDELLRQRTYLIKMQALPYGRTATLTTTATQSSSPSFILVDDCNSATGWTVSESGGTLAVVSGKVVLTDSNHYPFKFTYDVTRPGNIDMSTARYLVIDAAWTVPWTTLSIFAHGAFLGSMNLAARLDLGGGITRLWFSIPVGSGTAYEVLFEVSGVYGSGTDTFSFDKIQLSDAIPFIGTNHQKVMSLVPGGSVNAQGSIAVSHASSALGKTIVFTHPIGTGYTPPLSPYRVSGDTRSVDAAAVSGNTATLTGVSTWKVPQPNLPSGRVEVWAFLKASATTTFTMNWSLFSQMGSTGLSADAYTISLSLPSTYVLTFLGAAIMPPVAMGSAGLVALQMQASGAGTPAVSWDEVYLFATDQGRLTVVDCGTASPASGGASNRLWIDAPDSTQPLGGIWRGNATDRSDQWHAGPQAQPWEVHEFAPTGANIFVVTQNAADASTALTHYRRYQTYVVNEG